MSTRCQVKVEHTVPGVGDGEPWNEKVTLYHHTDGYPSYMVPLIKECWSRFHEYKIGKGKNAICSYWECGRAGKVAGLLCATDPYVFEPEDSHILHGDIEYYYILHCVNPGGGHCGDKPYWELEIYTSHKCKNWWKRKYPKLKHMRCILPRTKLNKVPDNGAIEE